MARPRPKKCFTLLEVIDELCNSSDEEQDHNSSDDEPDALLPKEMSDSTQEQ